jgi:hypothetical protein
VWAVLSDTFIAIHGQRRRPVADRELRQGIVVENDECQECR